MATSGKSTKDQKERATQTKERESVDVEVKPESGVAIPTAGKPAIPEGVGGVDDSQISLPRIVLLQQNSAEVARPEDPLKSGAFYNRLTKEDLGRKLEIIPFSHFRTRVALNQEQGLVCRSSDTFIAQLKGGLTPTGAATDDCSICVRKLWPNDRERETGETLEGKLATSGPECSIVENFFALVVNGDDPAFYEFVVLQFMRTSAKAAKDLKGLWVGSRQPLSSFHYSLTSQSAQNKSGKPYYVAEIGRVMDTDGKQKKPRRTTSDEDKAVKDQVEFMKNRINLDELAQAPMEETEAGSGDTASATETARRHDI